MALSNAKIKMRLALRYTVVVGINMQIFGLYVCSNESILSLTLDPEGRFFSDSNFIHNINSDIQGNFLFIVFIFAFYVC